MQNDKYAPPEAPQHGYPQLGYPPQQGVPQPVYASQHGYPHPLYSPQPGFPPQDPPPNYQPPHQAGNPPPYNYPTTPAQIYVPLSQGNWYNRNQRNKPQSNSVAAGALIFLSGGMNIAWSVGFRSVGFLRVTQLTSIAWFIAAIIGAIISLCLTNKVSKKVVMIFASVIAMVGGITRASVSNDLRVIEASLYLDGVANGLVFAPLMALAGEVAVSYMRGQITASIEQMCVMIGFFIQVIYTESWSSNNSYYYNAFTSDQMHGILSAIYGLIALITAAFLVIESPVILLAKGHEQEAISALRQLQNPHVITTETYAQLEEHKRYLAMNKNLSTTESIVQGLPALLRLIFLRALNAMSLSPFVFYALVFSVGYGVSFYKLFWEFIVFALCRWLGNFITSFCLESVGRKKPTLLGLLVSGGFAFGVGSIIGTNSFGLSNYVLFYLLCIYQLFAGVAFTATSTYLSEAFPLGVKQTYIGFTFIAEMLVFIIISCSKYSISGNSIFFFILGGFSVAGSILGIFCLPETRGTTLREAQDKFRGMFSKS